MIITITGELDRRYELTVEWTPSVLTMHRPPRTQEATVRVTEDDDDIDTFAVDGDPLPAALREPILIACREVYRDAVAARRWNVCERREVAP